MKLILAVTLDCLEVADRQRSVDFERLGKLADALAHPDLDDGAPAAVAVVAGDGALRQHAVGDAVIAAEQFLRGVAAPGPGLPRRVLPSKTLQA
jgi:hypothetical protein